MDFEPYAPSNNEPAAFIAQPVLHEGEVAVSTNKVGELVGEIAAASSEQAQGIDQVNTAVNEVDKVTQQNDASAEESASASEEMNAQAQQMRGFVSELIQVVGTSKRNDRSVVKAASRLKSQKIRNILHISKDGKTAKEETPNKPVQPTCLSPSYLLGLISTKMGVLSTLYRLQYELEDCIQDTIYDYNLYDRAVLN